MFCSIIFLDLKKWPNIENNLLDIILENFNPTILKKINKQTINKNCKQVNRNTKFKIKINI